MLDTAAATHGLKDGERLSGRTTQAMQDVQNADTFAYRESSTNVIPQAGRDKLEEVLGAYLQQTWTPSSWLALNAGVRVDASDRRLDYALHQCPACDRTMLISGKLAWAVARRGKEEERSATLFEHVRITREQLERLIAALP